MGFSFPLNIIRLIMHIVMRIEPDAQTLLVLRQDGVPT